ncbi:hypothetical protein ACEPAH_7526 [Sanghuangporus vaninii]
MAPFGAWDSPITAEYVAKPGVSFDDVLVDPLPSQAHPDSNAIYYIEIPKRYETRASSITTSAAPTIDNESLQSPSYFSSTKELGS